MRLLLVEETLMPGLHLPQSMCLRRALVLAAVLGADAFTPGSREHALARWVESEGGFVGDVASETRDGVRGLYATKDVPKGTLLLRVPEACCIAADEDPQWGLSLRELATARLVGSLSRGERTAYTDALPADEPLLCEWTDAELLELQSPRLAEVARGMSPFLDESVARVLPYVQGTEADVRRAERSVRSRALVFDSGFNYQPSMALVPLIDLANHRTPTADDVEPVGIDAAAKAIALVAPRDLSSGDEVTICYRYEGNEKLLLDYGFAELLRPGQTCYEALHLGDGVVCDSPSADARALDALGAARFRDLLRTSLASAPTTLEEDRALLAERPPPRYRHALVYRAGQKALLAAAVAALEDPDPAAALAAIRLVPS